MPFKSWGIVSPYTGGWIEITSRLSILKVNAVSPYTGEWIEIIDEIFLNREVRRLTLHR